MPPTRLATAIAVAATVALLTAACSSPSSDAVAGSGPSAEAASAAASPAPEVTQASASPTFDPYLDSDDCTGKGTYDALQAIGHWQYEYLAPLPTTDSGQQAAINAAMSHIPALVTQIRSDAAESKDSHDRQVLESTADDFAQLPGWMATDTSDIAQKTDDLSQDFQRIIRYLSPCPTFVLQ